MKQFDYNKYLNNNPLLKEAKNVKKDGDETWFSDANYFKKEHEGYKLKPTDMVAVGDSKAMTYAQAKKKFGGAMKEAKQSRLKEYSDPLDTMRQAFMMLTDLQDELKSMKASGNIPSGEEVVDMVLSVMAEMEALENDDMGTAEPIQEDLALVGNIALGVVGGLAGLYALVKTTKFLGYVAGEGLMALKNKLQSSAKTAARGRRKEFIMGIIKKFEGDTELQSMYAALPPYTPKTKNERNNQMKKIATYIKSKLSPEEMDYFNDISSMLRTGDLA